MKSDVAAIVRNPVRPRREGNPYYPLPPNYHKLDTVGQRIARINAVSLQETAEDVVYAWNAFRDFYLRPEPACLEWYQGAEGFVPSPPAHYRLIWAAAKFPRVAFAAIRSFAKSTVFREMRLLHAYTKCNFKQLLVTAREFQIWKDLDTMQRQITGNQFLLNDFGNIKPKRGSGIWSRSHMRLESGYELIGRPVGGAMLGERPRAIHFDDVEFDPNVQKVSSDLTDNFMELLTQTLLPMLDKGSMISMIGTLFSRKMFLYHVLTNDDDERFNFWWREIIGDRYDEGDLTWGEKFDEEYLAQRRAELGNAAYNAQMRNKPGTDEDMIFRIVPLHNEYAVEDEDPAYIENPLRSDAKLVTWLPEHDERTGEKKWEILRRPFGTTVGQMYRFMSTDYAPTVSKTSDFSCAMVWGLENTSEHRDTLYLLDMWYGKEKLDLLSDRLWRMALLWRVRVLGVESIAVYNQLSERVLADFGERAQVTGWMPRVYPIKYPTQIDKGDRISGVEYRFNLGRFKFPKHRMRQEPWCELQYQIDNFTPDLKLLKYDDVIDTVGQVQYVVRPRGGAADLPPDEAPKTIVERMAAGERYVPGTRIPLAYGVNAEEVPPEVWAKYKERHPRARGGRRCRGYRRVRRRDTGERRARNLSPFMH